MKVRVEKSANGISSTRQRASTTGRSCLRRGWILSRESSRNSEPLTSTIPKTTGSDQIESKKSSAIYRRRLRHFSSSIEIFYRKKDSLQKREKKVIMKTFFSLFLYVENQSIYYFLFRLILLPNVRQSKMPS